MSNIVLLTYGRNAYDHSMDVDYDTYYGSFVNDSVRLNVYMARAKQYAARPDTGWYSMIEVNLITGESKVWFTHTNPLKVRVELNIPAKEAQAIRKVKRLSTVSTVGSLLQELTTANPFDVQPANYIDGFTIQDNMPEDSHNEEEEEE